MKKHIALPAATRTPAAEKALYLSHFTPSMMPPATLQSMLVQRQPLLDACYADVVDSVTSTAKHHYLFVGPRGIGKTHFVSLLHHRLEHSSEMRQHGMLAWMREEEWGVTSFFELVLRILRTLDAALPALGIAEKTAPLYELPLRQAEMRAPSLLLEVLGSRTLVVLMENLDDLFGQLGDAGQWQLRAFLQNHPQLVMVTTTPALFAGVSLQKSPFNGFFDIQPLQEFELEDVLLLLEKIAIERGDPLLVEFIRTPQGRAHIRAVHHLAEGNPRIYVIFAQFLSREALDELVQAVMHTLDELTPYYQARMKELSGQQRKIVEYLVHYRGAAPVRQIAKACFITQQTCSGQLKQLRDKRYVRSIAHGRESFYELTEPLMRLCMEVKQQRGEPIGLFVEILRIWYTEAELRDWLVDAGSNPCLDALYVQRSLDVMRTNEDLEPVIKAQLNELQGYFAQDNLVRAQQVLDEMAATKPANAHSRMVRAQVLLAFLEYLPDSRSRLWDERDTLADTFAAAAQFAGRELKKSNAIDACTALWSASMGMLELDEPLGKAALQTLAAPLARFPAHAAMALLPALGSTSAEKRQASLERIVMVLESFTNTTPLPRLLRVFRRLASAIVQWRRTGDSQHLLALPREERQLVLGEKEQYPPFSA